MCSNANLIQNLYNHIDKLSFSLNNGHELNPEQASAKVYSDAADCANLLMMLADNYKYNKDF